MDPKSGVQMNVDDLSEDPSDRTDATYSSKLAFFPIATNPDPFGSNVMTTFFMVLFSPILNLMAADGVVDVFGPKFICDADN
ncbi:hypothetical protein [Paramuribaculum intestinale]|uniref:hypothetical protein n=2 Tax=Paramuribaculum intestinale TaxID=2094151 RepID=UPI0027341807|nr:hypothetical protein [Paramuribaculum intestinale]